MSGKSNISNLTPVERASYSCNMDHIFWSEGEAAPNSLSASYRYLIAKLRGRILAANGEG